MDEFTTLDEKIQSGEYDDAEEARFEELSRLYAQEKVKDYELTDEEQKQLLSKQMNLNEEGQSLKSKSAQDFIEKAA